MAGQATGGAVPGAGAARRVLARSSGRWSDRTIPPGHPVRAMAQHARNSIIYAKFTRKAGYASPRRLALGSAPVQPR